MLPAAFTVFNPHLSFLAEMVRFHTTSSCTTELLARPPLDLYYSSWFWYILLHLDNLAFQWNKTTGLWKWHRGILLKTVLCGGIEQGGFGTRIDQNLPWWIFPKYEGRTESALLSEKSGGWCPVRKEIGSTIELIHKVVNLFVRFEHSFFLGATTMYSHTVREMLCYV